MKARTMIVKASSEYFTIMISWKVYPQFLIKPKWNLRPVLVVDNKEHHI